MKPSKGLRVLFLGDTSSTSTSIHYVSSLIKLDHSVYQFNSDPWHRLNWMERWNLRLNKRVPSSVTERISHELIEICRKNQFDLIFAMGQNFLSALTLNQMRRVSKFPPKLAFHSHDNVFSPGVLKSNHFMAALQTYDQVFTTKSQNVEKYRALGQGRTHYIPSAYEPSVHHPIADNYSRFNKDQFEITFVGTYDKSRVVQLDAVGWNHLHVWGDFWKKYEGYESRMNRIHPHAVYHQEYSDILSHSQCVLGLLREEAGDLHTQRTFEIPACGVLQIAPRNDEILSFFKEDKEIVCFKTNEELQDKTQFYLKRPEKRLEIAKKGFERVMKGKHTYLDRMSEIIKVTMGKKTASIRAAG
jgi:spore maturation protein CgeB